jgi:ethanolamine utilization microcompartment shell protein EutS
MVHPGKRGHKIVAVLQFKFDESFNERFMCVGGFIGAESEWKKLEKLWQKRVDFENAHNQADQQITRFHASHINAHDHEFKNWDKEMCKKFGQKLIGLIGKRSIGAIAIAADIDALKSVFPSEDDSVRKDSTYALCIRQMMVEIGHIMREYFPGDQVLLIHDHGDWDIQALAAYNRMVDDPKWISRELFVSIAPMTGAESVGLQAADLIAYEMFRRVKDKELKNSDDMRAAMKEMKKRGVPVAARYMDINGVKALRRIMEESGLHDD